MFQEQKPIFKGSIEWYAVTVKHDMEASGVIESFTEKGKKLHPLKRKDSFLILIFLNHIYPSFTTGLLTEQF
jgi:hypothetical protein